MRGNTAVSADTSVMFSADQASHVALMICVNRLSDRKRERERGREKEREGEREGENVFVFFQLTQQISEFMFYGNKIWPSPSPPCLQMVPVERG